MVEKIKELMGNLPDGRVSRLVLGALAIVALLIFCLFLFVGFATPSMLVPGFYEPQFTDTLLIYMYVIVTMAVVIMIISIGFGAWKRGWSMKVKCGPVTAIVVGVLALLVITMLTTFMLADTNAMTIGGKPYEDTLWLRLSDMFINTTLVLLVVAVLLMVVRRKGDNV